MAARDIQRDGECLVDRRGDDRVGQVVPRDEPRLGESPTDLFDACLGRLEPTADRHSGQDPAGIAGLTAKLGTGAIAAHTGMVPHVAAVPVHPLKITQAALDLDDPNYPFTWLPPEDPHGHASELAERGPEAFPD